MHVVETQDLCPWFILWEGQFCSTEPKAFCQFPTVVFIPWPFSGLTPLPPQGWKTVERRWSYSFLDIWLFFLLYITLWLTGHYFFSSENTLYANLCALADHNINACPLIQCLPVCLSSPCSPAFSCFTFPLFCLWLCLIQSTSVAELQATETGTDTVIRLIDRVNKPAPWFWSTLQRPVFMGLWQRCPFPLFLYLLIIEAYWLFCCTNLLTNMLHPISRDFNYCCFYYYYDHYCSFTFR